MFFYPCLSRDFSFSLYPLGCPSHKSHYNKAFTEIMLV